MRSLPDHGGMNAIKPLHIFKAGRRKAMCGLTLDFSESDLEASARAYDPARHEAPIVIGHPKHDAPAYGWVKSLAVDGDGLRAESQQVDAEFAELVTTGRYKKISASFYLPHAANNPVPGVYYLRHVGFLGAMAPAVKGLKQAEFADAEDGVIAFADWGMETTASLWRRLREWMIGKHGQEVADEVVPNWQIDSISEAARLDDNRGSFADPTHNQVLPNTIITTNKEQQVTPEEQNRLESENARLKAELAAANSEKQAAAATRRHADHVAYAEQLITDGQLAPKHKSAVVAFLDFADGDSVIEFGDGDEKQPLAQAFKGFLSGLPKVVDFGEHATKGKSGKGGDIGSAEFAEKQTDPERLSLHVDATALAAEKGISYEQAVRSLL